MQGQLLLSLIVGVLVFLWLTILGIPYALLLAVFSALAELIPVFGSFIAAIPALALSFTTGGPTLLVLVAGGYLIINLLQANLIYPLVVKQVVGVPPILVILALIAGAQLAGFLGVLLSVPIAAAVQEFVHDVMKGKERELARMAKSGG
jgi:predicted PurR-regulated permease PerM